MKSEHWAIAATVVAGLALVGFFAAPALLKGPPRNDETLCLATGAVGHSVVVVDKSDPWSKVQADRLKTLIKSIGADLPAEQMLSIYVFQDVFEPGFPALFRLCNPGRTASELIGNPRRDYVRWTERFGRPLDDALASLSQPARGNQSPITEAVSDILTRPETRVASGEKRVILVSDMLQNSPAFSAFGNSAASRDPERLAKAMGRGWQEAAQQGWQLRVHQVQGVYDASRLEQAQTVWRAALDRLGIKYVWERL